MTAAQQAPPPKPFPFQPVQWDGDEPYLEVEPDVRLTPFRDGDQDAQWLTEISNHPDIGQWSYGRPFPYDLKDAHARLAEVCPGQGSAVEALRGHPNPAAVSELPFTAIRHRGRMVGDIVLFKQDRDTWGISYTLLPEFRGRGLGRRAVELVLGWASRGMVVRKVEAMVETRNPASESLMRKLEFNLKETKDVKWPEEKGGEMRHVGIWVRDVPEPEGPWVVTSAGPSFLAPTAEWDGDEPYLIPSGRDDVIVTPYRNTPRDVKEIMELCNAPGVAKWSHGRPFPFTEESAQKRLAPMIPKQAETVALMRDGHAPKVNPFSVIRERATGRYIGDLALLEDYHSGRWELAYALHPDFHSRGIATAVMRAILAWGKEHLEARKIECYVQTANPASSRLAEKLGFVVAEKLMIQWPEDKGGDWREVAIWQREM